MRKYKALIVEDKKKDVKRLLSLLEPYRDILEVSAIAYSFEEAVLIFSKEYGKSFDVSILDYKLNNGKTIFDLFNVVGDRTRFGVIALTSVLKAELSDISLNITKPITFTKTHTSEKIAKFILRFQEVLETMDSKLNKDLLVSDGLSRKVPFRDIYFIKVDGRNCFVYCKDNTTAKGFKQLKHNKSKTEIMARLDPDIFLDCHRSYIINTALIAFCKKDGRGATVYFRDIDNTKDGDLSMIAYASQDGRARLAQLDFIE